MEPTEVRIGNLILFDHHETREPANIVQIGRVTGITAQGIEFRGGIVRKLDRCAGIPLTEEWLKKHGFYESEVHENGKGWRHPDTTTFELFRPNDLGYYKAVRMDRSSMICHVISGHISHVHQLQNLYYALTGTELTFK